LGWEKSETDLSKPKFQNLSKKRQSRIEDRNRGRYVPERTNPEGFAAEELEEHTRKVQKKNGQLRISGGGNHGDLLALRHTGMFYMQTMWSRIIQTSMRGIGLTIR